MLKSERTPLTLKPRRNLADEVAASLAEAIIRGDLAPNERLREQDLVQRLEVSRGTLREALLVLERQHLAVSSPGKGARVAALDLAWVEDIHEVWYALFAVLLVRISRDASEESLEKIAGAVAELASGAETPANFLDQTLAMVALLCELHGDTLLTRQLRSLTPASLRCFRHALSNDPNEIAATRAFATQVLKLALDRRGGEVRAAVARFASEQFERMRSLLD